jgi:hypothetical protein
MLYLGVYIRATSMQCPLLPFEMVIGGVFGDPSGIGRHRTHYQRPYMFTSMTLFKNVDKIK